MSKNAFGKTQFGPGRYGQVGVNIDELAGQIAKEMVASAEPAKRAQREAKAKEALGADPEIWVIARRRTDGSYKLETVEEIGALGMLTSSGATLPIALANLKFLTNQRLRLRKQCRNLDDASERVAKMQFHVMDLTESKIQVGAGS